MRSIWSKTIYPVSYIQLESRVRMYMSPSHVGIPCQPLPAFHEPPVPVCRNPFRPLLKIVLSHSKGIVVVVVCVWVVGRRGCDWYVVVCVEVLVVVVKSWLSSSCWSSYGEVCVFRRRSMLSWSWSKSVVLCQWSAVACVLVVVVQSW